MPALGPGPPPPDPAAPHCVVQGDDARPATSHAAYTRFRDVPRGNCVRNSGSSVLLGVGMDARRVLAADRAGTEQTIAALTRDLDRIVEAGSGTATDDEHDPEGSTIAFERAQVAALLGQAREHLAAVESAEQRLRTGTYGRCQRCGAPIAGTRLEQCAEMGWRDMERALSTSVAAAYVNGPA